MYIKQFAVFSVNSITSKGALAELKSDFSPPTESSSLWGITLELFQTEKKTKLRKIRVLTYTPWKFNIDPENKPSQKEIHLPTMIFQGLG